MPLKFDPQCQAAIDLAKKALTDSAPLDVGLLLDALYHHAHLDSRYPALEKYLRAPIAQKKEVPDKVSLAPELRPLFQQFMETVRKSQG